MAFADLFLSISLWISIFIFFYILNRIKYTQIFSILIFSVPWDILQTFSNIFPERFHIHLFQILWSTTSKALETCKKVLVSICLEFRLPAKSTTYTVYIFFETQIHINFYQRTCVFPKYLQFQYFWYSWS